MTLTLYNFSQSTCSQNVRLSQWEKGLAFEDRTVDHKTREHLYPAYLAPNPNGVVPTLVHDGAVIINSSVICEYLDEVFPENSLSMSEPVGQAHMRKWLRYFEEVPTPAIRVPSFNQYLARRYETMSDDQYTQMAENQSIRKHFYQRLGKNQFSDAETRESIDRLQQTVDRVGAALGADGRPWLIGDRLTIADICLMPTIDRMADLGLQSMCEEEYPYVTGWYDRFAARDAFARTYYRGTRLTEIFDSAG
jgi:glutathione S-transferase